MQVKDITQHPVQWDDFLQQQLNTLFVQSSLYGTFSDRTGEKHWILGIERNGALVGGSLIVSLHARRGSFLFLPYGPILPEEGSEEALEAMTDALNDLARREQYAFVRVSPFMDDTIENQKKFFRLGFRSAPIHMLAETTWMLDVSRPEETLLARMNKNHRNLIRRCERVGVRVTTSMASDALEDFHRLHDSTARRHHFVRFSKTYIDAEFNAFAGLGHAAVLRGYLPTGELDAAAIIIQYGTMSCYRHGASLGLDSRIPSSYLVQWEAIRHTKQNGIRWYNFWGIAPPKARKRHPFAGITHFKTGFGGEMKCLLPAMDLPLSIRYWHTWAIESTRRVKRGF